MEFEYMSWGKLIREITDCIVGRAPQGGRVLDLLCGPGYLLGQLQKKRSDISCLGVDLEEEFICHAKRLYPSIGFEVADAFNWRTENKFDVVICTAGVHHLPFERQEAFIARLRGFLNTGGFAVVADPYISNFETEQERQLACTELGSAYLIEAIKRGAPSEVVKAGVGILENDLLLVEWKTSVSKQRPIFEKYFSHVEERHVWPSIGEYGDYYFVLSN